MEEYTVKRTLTLIVGTAIVLGTYVVPGVAQQPAQPPASPLPSLVAVVDVAQIIKSHPEFVTKQEGLKTQVQRAEATFQARQEEIQKRHKAMESGPHRPNSPDHQRMLEEITRDMAQFEADAKSQQRRFALENAKIMYETYKDIKNTIERIATASGIAQVTDYRFFEVDPSDPNTVAEDMDQRLVWFSPRLNITNTVIQQIYKDRNLPLPAQGTAPQVATPGTQTR